SIFATKSVTCGRRRACISARVAVPGCSRASQSRPDQPTRIRGCRPQALSWGPNIETVARGIALGTNDMRQTRRLLGTIGLFAFAMSATGAAARDEGACGQIRAACLGAGFVQGAAREGIGLQIHCMMPIMQARPQPANARRPLPKVDAQLIAACKMSRLRFG